MTHSYPFFDLKDIAKQIEQQLQDEQNDKYKPEEIESAIYQILWDYCEMKFETLPNNEFYLKELCGCIRKAYYERKFAIPPKPESYPLKVYVGLILHKVLTHGLAKHFNGEPEVLECYEHNGIKIYSRCDILLDDEVWEIKVKIHHSKPNIIDYRQLNAYLHIYDKPIGRFIILILNDNGKPKRRYKPVNIVKVTPNHKMFLDVIVRAEYLKRCLDSDTEPQVQLSDQERRLLCSRCVYKQLCTGF